jgi:hypothetical protein
VSKANDELEYSLRKNPGHSGAIEIARLRAEVERLRAMSWDWQMQMRYNDVTDERARLRAALERIVNRTQLTSGSAAADACEIARAALAGGAP